MTPELAPLPPDFFLQKALPLARALLGKLLLHAMPEGLAGGRIVETEAYTGKDDRACHSFGLSSPTPGHRTEVMFSPGGRAYVYLIYGMYHCFNVVSGPEGSPEAVLIRAIEPLFGLALMEKRRGTADPKKLASGPGKLCQALAVTREQSGELLTKSPLFIAGGPDVPDSEVAVTPRINVDYAGEAARLPCRFVVADSPFISTKKFLRKKTGG